MSSLLDADPLLLLRTVLGVAVMVLAVMVILRAAGVSLGAQPVLAIGRAIGQLAIASLVLSGVLSVPWTAVLVLVLMVSTASATSGGRLRPMPGGRAAAATGILVGGAAAILAVFALGLVELSARHAIAIGGIVIGNAMTASTLAGRSFRSQAQLRAGEVEAWWALGATSPVAFAEMARAAVRDAMVPNMDQTRSTGVVTLPGAFIGALFGGASPLEAARFQIIVLAAIMLGQGVAAVVVTRRLSRMRVLPAEPTG
ncbi:ABC transporter permease [Brachybacterium phenoliresistens]|uniref:ABC transporter permease n=1 Tax=Brachybacterium phenoliresistens TaxID=396014 RepID=UPI0031D61E85